MNLFSISTAAAQTLPLLYSQSQSQVFPRSFRFRTKPSLFGLTSALPQFGCRLQCISASAASADGGENPIAAEVDDVSASDVIILDVGGMMCGGCAASVKRILENQAQVSSASVNHTTETAIVWPLSEVKVTPNWQKVMGEELAKHLTTCGFNSNLRGEAS